MKSPLSDAFSDLSNSELISVFAAGPDRLRRAVEGLTATELNETPRPDKWSVQQIVFHVVDAEIVGALRFKLAYAQPGSLFPGYDQDIWAQKFEYRSADPRFLHETLQLFRILRTASLHILRKSVTGDFEKTGIHPERGVMTLRQLLELYADHSERHIDQILYIRKMIGKELPLPEILTKRLY